MVVRTQRAVWGGPSVKSCGLQPGTCPPRGDPPEREGAQGKHCQLPLLPPVVSYLPCCLTKPNQKPKGVRLAAAATHVCLQGREGGDRLAQGLSQIPGLSGSDPTASLSLAQ